MGAISFPSCCPNHRRGIAYPRFCAAGASAHNGPSSDVNTIRTPHSGYHFDGSIRRFMEGWYFKVSLPEEKQSFAWMYSVEDPGSSKCQGESFLGRRFPGIGAQVLGADDEYLWQYDENMQNFWADRQELALGHTFLPRRNVIPPRMKEDAQKFKEIVEEGFQVTTTWHQGFLRDNGRSNELETVETVRWEYSTKPIYGWGDRGAEQLATAGWLAAFPVFEPHWQICMAGGLSTGWIEWGDRKFNFTNAPSYSEKNWGGSFPKKWFWIQCNVFEGASGDIALTAGGGKRGLPFFPETSEEVALVGVHCAGNFYQFVPWLGQVEWEISPWGYWKMYARTEQYELNLEARTESSGTVLRAPTADAGLAPFCKDTFSGTLTLQIREYDGTGKQSGKIILDVKSDMVALEIGGGPWYSTWKNASKMQEPVRTLTGLPIDIGSIFGGIPQLKPPGI